MRTKTVKKASRVIIEKYYGRLTMDFDTNKRVIEDIASVPSKRLRNKIAGFTTVRLPCSLMVEVFCALTVQAACCCILCGGCRCLQPCQLQQIVAAGRQHAVLFVFTTGVS